ncbi:MAG: hypothetical protein ITG02_07980 [Patulibacter sp.]|nr:hypothetical protein [Patulibacter sp.]
MDSPHPPGGSTTTPVRAPAPRRPRLLLVGFATSFHIARYVELLRGSEWELHLFDAVPPSDPHPDLEGTMTYYVDDAERVSVGEGITVVADPERGSGVDGRIAHLARVIEELRPDVIHSHETAISGAVTYAAHELLGGFDAPWLATNWGSDLFWNGRSPAVAPRLREVLSTCDYYCAECHRDIGLARAFGFRGEVLGVWSVAGGVDPQLAVAHRAPGPPSARRTIALKGVDNFFGRAEVGLAAIRRCAPLLEGWELCGYQMDEPVRVQAVALADEIGMRYTHMSGADLRTSTYEEILAMHGRARVSLGLNLTDGVSSSFFEALVMGSLPLQGRGSCGYELTPHGHGALFVDARDVDEVTAALERAITDDALVDGAAELNARIATEHVDRDRIRARILDGYERIVSQKAMEVL